MVDMFVKHNVKEVKEKIRELVKRELGYDIKFPHAVRFTPKCITGKIEISIPGEDGESNSDSVRQFDLYARFAGFPENSLNKVIKLRNGARVEEFRIVGWNKRRHAYPVDAIRVKDGKEYKLPILQVKLALEDLTRNG